MSRRHTSRSNAKPSPVRQGLAVLVLVGYLLILCGSSAGHGWHLMLHLLSQHHGLERMADLRPPPAHPTHLAHSEAPGHHEASEHHRGAPHHHESGHHQRSADHDAEPPRNAQHEHHGRAHTHESQRDPAPSAPALLTVSLDKHCFFAGPVLAPPPVQDRDDVRPATALFSTALPVETPPPRRS